MGTVINTAGQDLTASVARLTASTTAELAAVATALTNAQGTDGSVPAAAVESAVTSLNAVSDQLDALTAQLTPPPPVVV